MGFIATRHRKRGRFDLGEALGGEKLPNRRPDPPASLEKRLAVGINMTVPPGRSARHSGAVQFQRAQTRGKDLPGRAKCGFRPHIEFNPFIDQTGLRQQSPQRSGMDRVPLRYEEKNVKVIASNIRKGNILEEKTASSMSS